MIKARDKQILMNMASSWGAFAVGTAIYFFLTPYMRKNLGDGTLGIWYLLGSLLSYAGWMKTGLIVALTKHVAEYRVQNNHDKLLTAVHSVFVINVLFSLLIFCIGLLLFWAADRIPAIQKTSMPDQAKFALLLMAIHFAINLPLAVIAATISGLQRYDFNNLMQIVGILVQAFGFILVIHYGYGLVGLALCQMTVAGFINLVSWVFLKSIYPFQVSPRWIKIEMIRDLFRFGFYSFLLNIGNYLSCQITPIIIGFLLNDAAIFCYVIAVKLLEFMETLSGEAILVLLPVASEFSVLEEKQKAEKILELMIRGSRFSVLLTLPPILFMAVFGESAISLWQGMSYHGSRESYLVFLILTLPYLLKIAMQITGPLMVGLGVHKIFAIFWVLLSGLNLILSVILGKILGLVGIALGGSASFLIVLGLGQFCIKSIFRIPMLHFYRKAWFHLAWMGGGYMTILIGIRAFWIPGSILDFFLFAGICGFAFWIAGYWIMDEYEKKVIRNVLHAIVRKGNS